MQRDDGSDHEEDERDSGQRHRHHQRHPECKGRVQAGMSRAAGSTGTTRGVPCIPWQSRHPSSRYAPSLGLFPMWVALRVGDTVPRTAAGRRSLLMGLGCLGLPAVASVRLAISDVCRRTHARCTVPANSEEGSISPPPFYMQTGYPYPCDLSRLTVSPDDIHLVQRSLSPPATPVQKQPSVEESPICNPTVDVPRSAASRRKQSAS
jgi:hypothetical protein